MNTLTTVCDRTDGRKCLDDILNPAAQDLKMGVFGYVYPGQRHKEDIRKDIKEEIR